VVSVTDNELALYYQKLFRIRYHVSQLLTTFQAKPNNQKDGKYVATCMGSEF
jgi:hypothetical protein